MYTYNRTISDKNDYTLRRRIVNVEFTNGESVINKVIEFRIGESDDVVRKAFAQYRDELNTPSPTPISDINYTPPVVEEPVVDTARESWIQAYTELKAAVRLQELGATVVTPTQLTALRNKVQSEFKREYADIIL